jgi:multidrug efflux system membrane fusion protein
MKAEIANANGGISPGQFLNIRLRLQTLQDVVTLPAEAVQQGPEGSFVYVVNEDGSAKIRKVELIQTNTQTQGGRIALSKGVSAGETVVTDGYSRLTPGSKVKIKTPGAKEASSSPPRADLGRD